jgi:malonyl-CoA/methylmalonyl-CoA synthetase
MAADGRITIAGRARDLVISGGYNVYPREIEARLDDLDGIVEAAVIGVPHPDLGEAVVAVLVVANPAAFDEQATLAALDATLARFKQPKRFFLVDALPRNAMGKVEKNLLRERYGALFSGA